MQVGYGEALATHTGPEPCVCTRKRIDQALKGERTELLSRGLILFPMKGDDQMERGMTGHGMSPVIGMAGFERMGVQRMGLMGVLHRWGSYLYSKRSIRIN